MTKNDPTKHRPMKILVILRIVLLIRPIDLSERGRQSTLGRHSAVRQPVKGRHLTEGQYLIIVIIWFFLGSLQLSYLVHT